MIAIDLVIVAGLTWKQYPLKLNILKNEMREKNMPSRMRPLLLGVYYDLQ